MAGTPYWSHKYPHSRIRLLVGFKSNSLWRAIVCSLQIELLITQKHLSVVCLVFESSNLESESRVRVRRVVPESKSKSLYKVTRVRVTKNVTRVGLESEYTSRVIKVWSLYPSVPFDCVIVYRLLHCLTSIDCNYIPSALFGKQAHMHWYNKVAILLTSLFTFTFNFV